ncbi:MAG: hypothetical protein GY947_15885 [Rhodobacteraceae bacterium]|nr:hypothetical protein [Paracoccaceae bacterium]
MISVFRPLKGAICAAVLAIPNTSFAQVSSQSGFEQSTAILDTAVLFAIGAREAEQAIRGSFGWPTFQEGFVEGVYFRFDPDGYARFSPSPRLDEDVFEVLCAEASTACVAKKSVLEVGLTVAGQVQIKINGITPDDSFFVSDRKSELPLPATILGPLDPRLEALLAGGGELIVKREIETVQSVSLAGFSAVTTYLRWVAQRQSPRIFPRGWPVPAQSQDQAVSGLTQPNQWESPSTGPQTLQTTWHNRSPEQSANISPNAGAAPQGDPASNSQVELLQQQLIQLQLNLQQMQAGAAATRPANTSGLTLAGTAPASNRLQDYGQSFAQQAQGRSLPASPGGLGVGGDSASAFDQGSVWPSADNRAAAPQIGRNQPPVQDWSAGNVQYSQEVFRRLETVERSLHDLRRDVAIQILELRDMLHSRNPSGSLQATAPLATTPIQVQRSPAGVPEPSADDPTRILEELEKTLLNRLGAQNQSATSAVQSAPASRDGVTLDRKLIEDILAELGQADGTTGLTPDTEMTQPTVQPTTKPDGFVTLNDYINQVLQQEGLEARDPGR